MTSRTSDTDQWSSRSLGDDSGLPKRLTIESITNWATVNTNSQTNSYGLQALLCIIFKNLSLYLDYRPYSFSFFFCCIFKFFFLFLCDKCLQFKINIIYKEKLNSWGYFLHVLLLYDTFTKPYNNPNRQQRISDDIGHFETRFDLIRYISTSASMELSLKNIWCSKLCKFEALFYGLKRTISNPWVKFCILEEIHF